MLTVRLKCLFYSILSGITTGSATEICLEEIGPFSFHCGVSVPCFPLHATLFNSPEPNTTCSSSAGAQVKAKIPNSSWGKRSHSLLQKADADINKGRQTGACHFSALSRQCRVREAASFVLSGSRIQAGLEARISRQVPISGGGGLKLPFVNILQGCGNGPHVHLDATCPIFHITDLLSREKS